MQRQTTLACLPSALLAFGVFKVRHRLGRVKMSKEGLVMEGAWWSVSLLYPHKGKEAVLLLLWEGKEGGH